MAVTFRIVYYLTFDLSDMKWQDFVGEKSDFFVNKVTEITGYTRNIVHNVGSFQFVGNKTLSQLQQTQLNTYIKIEGLNGK